jgi:2-methylisocitrate lyase-like PEP mutase family enzyme
MTMSTGRAAATLLRDLHRPGHPVVLPNVWDAGSARIVAAAGFAAVGTSSAAVAESMGYRDGEAAPVEEILDAVARIVRAVSVPVTVDFERGYGLPPAQLVERLAASGAVGCNLEDSLPSTRALVDAHEQADFLAAVRDSARAATVDLVINARIDVFLDDVFLDGVESGAHTTTARLDEAIRRARLYVSAGADCVYPIRMTSAGDIRAIVDETGARVNILGAPGAPEIAELAALGVARVSFGAGIYRAAIQHVREIVAEIAASESDHGRAEVT